MWELFTLNPSGPRPLQVTEAALNIFSRKESAFRKSLDILGAHFHSRHPSDPVYYFSKVTVPVLNRAAKTICGVCRKNLSDQFQELSSSTVLGNHRKLGYVLELTCQIHPSQVASGLTQDWTDLHYFADWGLQRVFRSTNHVSHQFPTPNNLSTPTAMAARRSRTSRNWVFCFTNRRRGFVTFTSFRSKWQSAWCESCHINCAL